MKNWTLTLSSDADSDLSQTSTTIKLFLALSSISLFKTTGVACQRNALIDILYKLSSNYRKYYYQMNHYHQPFIIPLSLEATHPIGDPFLSFFHSSFPLFLSLFPIKRSSLSLRGVRPNTYLDKVEFRIQ